MATPLDPAPRVVCTHSVAVFASTNRKRKITGMGAIFWELRHDRARTKPIFRHSEAYSHSPLDEAQPVAVIRALELALERGLVRLQVRSNYYHSNRRPHGYSRSSPWSKSFQIRFKELLESFEVLQFGALAQFEHQVRAFARRAVRSGRAVPLHERAPYLPRVDLFEFADDDVDDDLLDSGIPDESILSGEWPDETGIRY